MTAVVLILATMVCLAAPVAAWWYLETWGQLVALVAVMLLVGGWWQSGPHDHWTGVVRETAARYVLACVSAVLGLLALPVVALAAAGRFISLLAVAPVAIFGGMAIEQALVDRGTLQPAPVMQGTGYWVIVGILGVAMLGVVLLVHRALHRFDSVGEAIVGARDGLTGLLAARFGVRFR